MEVPSTVAVLDFITPSAHCSESRRNPLGWVFGVNEASWKCIYDEIKYNFICVFQVMIFLEYKYKKTEFNDISNTLGDVKDTVDSGEPSRA